MDRTDVLASQEFTAEFARALAAASPSSMITVRGDLELSIQHVGEPEWTAFLANAYKEYCLYPEDFDELVQGRVASLLRTRSSESKLDRSRIVPVIRDRQWLVDLQTWVSAQNSGQAQLFDRFNEELVVVYAQDHLDRIEFLTAGEDLGISRDELRELAVANLRRILPEVEMRGSDGVMLITAGGNYEASLLLIDEIWSGGQLKVDGDIVVAVPTRDVLLVTGARNSAGLRTVRERAAKLVEQGAFCLTDTLFVYRDGRFTKFNAE